MRRVQIAIAFVVTLIGVFGAWMTAQIGKNQKLTNINSAQQEVISLHSNCGRAPADYSRWFEESAH
jgi:hypothetical protein